MDAGLFGGIVLLWALSLPIARRAGRRLHERSRIDELTELPNRTALEERLGHALARLERGRGCVALLFVDLDGFKTVNDTLGHATGDAVLRQIAERLHACTRTADTVSRFAGDEFVVILEDTDDVLAEQVARRILHEIREPVDGLGDLGLSASIGMAATNDASLDDDVLLRHADLPPGREFVVYVNLSAVQLNDRLLEVVDRCLAETGADPHRLGFEITETAVLASNDTVVIALLDQLRRRGCRIALDDFGTGYSSLSRLRATPLDLLKLDGSFVNRRSADGREQAILTAVSSLARQMDIQVLAEGVETQAQLDAVTLLGFDLAQGYHLARPAPAASVDGWLVHGLPSAAPVSQVRA